MYRGILPVIHFLQYKCNRSTYISLSDFNGGSKGGTPSPHKDQNVLNFMQFLGKFVCWRLPMEGWRPLLRGILDPLLTVVHRQMSHEGTTHVL